jgi:cytochrome c oxidase subunit II
MDRVTCDGDARVRVAQGPFGVERVQRLVGVGTRRAHGVASVVALGGAAGACSGPLSVLDPAGPAADSILTLMAVLLGLSILSFVVIFGLFLLTWRRRRRREPSLRLFLVGGGLVLPLVLLSVATVYAVVLGEHITGARQVPALRVEAQARQWRWEFTRQGAGGSVTLADVLDIPAGRSVEVFVTSADVIHSFWVPRLGGKIDAIPGSRNRILLRADVPGRYGGVCAEFCGTGHSAMGFSVVAHDESAWARIQGGERP